MRILFLLFLMVLVPFMTRLSAEKLEADLPDMQLKDSDFDALIESIFNKRKWEVLSRVKSQGYQIDRLLRGENREVKEIALDFPSFSLKFMANDSNPELKSEFPDYVFTTTYLKHFSLLEALQIMIKGLEGRRFKGEVGFRHSRHGSMMPPGGYVIEAEKQEAHKGMRTILPSEGDTPLVVFLPYQSDPILQGMMVCPRKITKVGNSITGRLLPPAPYKLAEISAPITAQILAKVIDGFGPGKISSEIIIEKFPQDPKPVVFSDYNEGQFPEAVSVLPLQYQTQTTEFVSGSINELAGRINAIIQDSSGSRWELSFKRGVAVREHLLTKDEALSFNKATFSVRPGICYAIIAYLDVYTKRQSSVGDTWFNLE